MAKGGPSRWPSHTCPRNRNLCGLRRGLAWPRPQGDSFICVWSEQQCFPGVSDPAKPGCKSQKILLYVRNSNPRVTVLGDDCMYVSQLGTGGHLERCLRKTGGCAGLKAPVLPWKLQAACRTLTFLPVAARHP